MGEEVAVDAGVGQAGEEREVAHRLATARGLLRSLEDRAAGAHPVAEPGADARVLPMVAPLAALFPGGGLRRGTTVAIAGVGGATSLLLALLAEASAGGAWAAVVGRPDLGLVAAAEAGVALERLALIPYPGADLVAVTAALLDGVDLVAVAGRVLHAGDRTRLAARARQRGAVLLALGPWPGADVELTCGQGRWRGVNAEEGDVGRLCARRVHVHLRGRGVGPAGRGARLLLPGSAGGPAVEGDVTPVDRGARLLPGSAGGPAVEGDVTAVDATGEDREAG